MDKMSRPMRYREPNYTKEEKTLLAKLIKRRPILAANTSDNKTITLKRVAWEAVTREFNRQANVHIKRDTNSLKRAWDNMKSNIRRALVQRGTIEPSSTFSLHYETINNIAAPACFCKNTDTQSDGENDAAFCNNTPSNNIIMEYNVDISSVDEEKVAEVSPSATVEDPLDIDDVYKEPRGSYKTRRAGDYVRREGAVRVQLVETRKRIETQILRTQPPLSANNFLYELDKVTQTITKHILDAKQVGTSGELKFKDYPSCTLDASFLQFINPPKLSVLRRQFLTFAKMNYVNEDANKIGRYFIQYLNKTLTD